MLEPGSQAAVKIRGDGLTYLPPARSSAGELLSPDL